MTALGSTSNPQLNSSNTYTNSFWGRFRSIAQQKAILLNDWKHQTTQWFSQQSLIKKIMISILAIVSVIAAMVFFILYQKFLHGMADFSDKWYKFDYGILILFLLIFFVGFPPLIGFSALSIFAGMSYGITYGWILLASASISGSLCSFLVFRHLLSSRAQKMIDYHENFRAFADILKEDSSLFLLILIRLCPLPYSLSNGALAAVPELPVLTYFFASLITSPKLMLTVFVGHKIKVLGDRSRSKSTKIIDIVTVIITGLIAAFTTYIIYDKMQQKLELYHQNQDYRNQDGYDRIVFGNFDDDLELGNEVELTTADYDADNFIIEDEDEIREHQEFPSKKLNQTEP